MMPEAFLMFSLQCWNDRGEAPALGMETWGRCRWHSGWVQRV